MNFIIPYECMCAELSTGVYGQIFLPKIVPEMYGMLELTLGLDEVKMICAYCTKMFLTYTTFFNDNLCTDNIIENIMIHYNLLSK